MSQFTRYIGSNTYELKTALGYEYRYNILYHVHVLILVPVLVLVVSYTTYMYIHVPGTIHSVARLMVYNYI